MLGGPHLAHSVIGMLLGKFSAPAALLVAGGFSYAQYRAEQYKRAFATVVQSTLGVEGVASRDPVVKNFLDTTDARLWVELKDPELWRFQTPAEFEEWTPPDKLPFFASLQSLWEVRPPWWLPGASSSDAWCANHLNAHLGKAPSDGRGADSRRLLEWAVNHTYRLSTHRILREYVQDLHTYSACAADDPRRESLQRKYHYAPEDAHASPPLQLSRAVVMIPQDCRNYSSGPLEHAIALKAGDSTPVLIADPFP